MPNIKYKFSFSQENIDELQAVIETRMPNSKLVTRAKVLLALNDSIAHPITSEEIALQCNTSSTTVKNIRAKLAKEGFNSTLYPKREIPAVTPKTSGIEEKVLQLIQTQPPKGRKKWSAQLLADQCVALGYVDSISHTSIAWKCNP